MAELNVSRQTISKLFTGMQNRKFIIPDYQRPYKWDIEKCETLWEDITNFHSTNINTESEYFLGTIVSYKNTETNQIEVIDGQQRITSFILLLRAFYKKLEEMPEDDEVKGLKNQIAPCIWDVNSISQLVTDKKKIHIESQVATEDDKQKLHDILETGIAIHTDLDKYSTNFIYFKERCDDYAQEFPLQWKAFCVSILHRCIILPIECDTPETALTIFSTLNDRGLPLADSDIFKAQLYKHALDEIERKDFTEKWKELTSICKNAKITLDDIFRYYTHVIRAKNNDKTKEVGLRKYYAGDNGLYSKLKDIHLMKDLKTLALFWQYVNTDIKNEDEIQYEFDFVTFKNLQILSHYPNEFWKYITSVYLLKNIDSDNFVQNFNFFLEKTVAFLFARFLINPSVNGIKYDIYQNCCTVQEHGDYTIIEEINTDVFLQNLTSNYSTKIIRGLLLINSYLNPKQTDLIIKNFEIEHIFPKKWQETNYNGWDENQAQVSLEKFGNKVVIEKKINIQAGNGYFGKKKSKYLSSNIQDVLELSVIPQSDWIQNDIEIREQLFQKNILSFLNIYFPNLHTLLL